jgi:hypothetical protein
MSFCNSKEATLVCAAHSYMFTYYVAVCFVDSVEHLLSHSLTMPVNQIEFNGVCTPGMPPRKGSGAL